MFIIPFTLLIELQGDFDRHTCTLGWAVLALVENFFKTLTFARLAKCSNMSGTVRVSTLCREYVVRGIQF